MCHCGCHTELWHPHPHLMACCLFSEVSSLRFLFSFDCSDRMWNPLYAVSINLSKLKFEQRQEIFTSGDASSRINYLSERKSVTNELPSVMWSKTLQLPGEILPPDERQTLIAGCDPTKQCWGGAGITRGMVCFIQHKFAWAGEWVICVELDRKAAAGPDVESVIVQYNTEPRASWECGTGDSGWCWLSRWPETVKICHNTRKGSNLLIMNAALCVHPHRLRFPIE